MKNALLLLSLLLTSIYARDVSPGNNTPREIKAKDMGVYGEVFPIQEKNLIEVIQAKLLKFQGEGKLEGYNQQVQAKVKSQIERPAPVKGIVHTKTPRTFTFDPSITVTHDLKDTHGNIFHHKGDRVNPLRMRPMTKQLLFIDGDEPLHLTWSLMMLKSYPLARIILVSGPPLQIMKDLGTTVYFDQFGKITEKLGITQVPAFVSQEGDVLRIQEVKPDKEGLIDEIVELRHQQSSKTAVTNKDKQVA